MTEVTRFPDDGLFGRFLRVFRHPLRALSMALATTAVAAGVTTGGGVVTAIVGAVLGVVAGELVGRTRVRLPTALGAFVVLGVLGLLLATLVTGSEMLAGFFGPANALGVSAMLRWGLGAFALVGALRVAGARYPTAMGVELGAVVVAVGVLFAAHRDGVIARPLWISDWAWQKGIDPADIFLALGAIAVVILAVLLVLEIKSGRTVSTLVSLPLLALLAVACLDVVGRPMPQAEDGLGLTTEDQGEPPNQMPEDPDQNGPDRNGGDGGTESGAQDSGAGGHGDAGSESSGASPDSGAVGRGLDGGLDGASQGALDGGADAGGGGGADAGGDGGGGGCADAGGDGGGGGGADAGGDGG
ncbi:MAG: hypothetical protein JRH11_13690, partial [Deltaproteobacteria bacterium]|nr:hypothetical protein [Deltaproteobacteria bacterium]